MIPTAQFDPATLTIWTTTGMLPEPEASFATAAVRAAMCGENPAQALTDISQKDPFRTRLLWFASSIWHEKRHYLDTCLTNYGARRFRDLFNLACNFLPIVAEAHHRGEPVWFPVEVYGCPVQRRVLGISNPPANVIAIAQHARSLKSLMNQFDSVVEKENNFIHLGGEAMLEGLAQISQTMSIEHCFGISDSLSVTTEFTHRLPLGGPYRAIEVVSITLGCSKDTGAAILLNPGLAAALFVTALCGRFFGVGAQPDSQLVLPQQRLSMMMEQLGSSVGRFDMSDEEAANLVDSVARRLWGRTALEEIEADINAMESKSGLVSAPWLVTAGFDEVYADFITLRRKLLGAAQQTGLAGLLPRAFPVIWRDRLLPGHVVATPAGSKDNDGRVVFGRMLNVPKGLENVVPDMVAWGKLYWASRDTLKESFAPSADAAWNRMIEQHAPRALLMLNGRRHRRMIPPELERPISETEEFGVPVRFHPRFEWPEQRDKNTCVAEAIALADFLGRDSFVCDATGETIKPEDAAVLTPWEFRRSNLPQEYIEENVLGQVQLLTDWSDWVVKKDLLR